MKPIPRLCAEDQVRFGGSRSRRRSCVCDAWGGGLKWIERRVNADEFPGLTALGRTSLRVVEAAFHI